MTQQNISNISIIPDWFPAGLEQWKILSSYWTKERSIRSVFIWVLLTIEIPILLLTLIALCCLVKSHRSASVFVIHLILSDLIQTICIVLLSLLPDGMPRVIVEAAHEYSLIVGVYFMLLIAFERYLLVSHPIWHRTHQSLKFTSLTSLVVWFVPLIFANREPPRLKFDNLITYVGFFVPYPIIILCFVGTWRGLSRSISLTSRKRKMILGSLFLVLLSYTFLILPYPITGFFTYITELKYRWTLPFVKTRRFVICVLQLNPLADCLLYLFMRSNAADLMPSFRCCRRSDATQISARYTPQKTHTSLS